MCLGCRSWFTMAFIECSDHGSFIMMHLLLVEECQLSGLGTELLLGRTLGKNGGYVSSVTFVFLPLRSWSR